MGYPLLVQIISRRFFFFFFCLQQVWCESIENFANLTSAATAYLNVASGRVELINELN